MEWCVKSGVPTSSGTGWTRTEGTGSAMEASAGGFADEGRGRRAQQTASAVGQNLVRRRISIRHCLRKEGLHAGEGL